MISRVCSAGREWYVGSASSVAFRKSRKLSPAAYAPGHPGTGRHTRPPCFRSRPASAAAIVRSSSLRNGREPVAAPFWRWSVTKS